MILTKKRIEELLNGPMVGYIHGDKQAAVKMLRSRYTAIAVVSGFNHRPHDPRIKIIYQQVKGGEVIGYMTITHDPDREQGPVIVDVITGGDYTLDDMLEHNDKRIHWAYIIRLAYLKECVKRRIV